MSHSACRRPENVVRNRFFHDGVRLQAGRIASAISQLRAVARLYDDDSNQTGRATQNHQQRRRRRSSSGGQRRRLSEQQRLKQQTPSRSNGPSAQLMPATVLLAYDSCPTEPETSARYPVGREDEANTAANRNDSLTNDGGVQTPVRSRRRSSSGTSGAERREGRHEEPEREGGRHGVQVRVVEFKPDRGEGNLQEESVCRGFGQVGEGSTSSSLLDPPVQRLAPRNMPEGVEVCHDSKGGDY